MKTVDANTLDANRLAAAAALAATLLWIACSAFVAVAPATALAVTGHMLHAELGGFRWTLTWTGFVAGLVSWAIVAGAGGWLVAWTYDRLLASSPAA